MTNAIEEAPSNSSEYDIHVSPQLISVVIPCFNEEAGVVHLPPRLLDLVAALYPTYACEFVFVDDGSVDATVARLRAGCEGKLRYRIVQHGANRGIAASILTGIQSAESDIVCSIDSDCSYDPLQLVRMLPMLGEGIDMVTASPYHPEGEVLNVPAWRLTISKSASAIYRRALNRPWHTFTSCCRIYRKEAVRDVELRYEGFVGIAELLWRLDRRGSRIVECPASLNVRRYGQSKMKVLRVTVGHMRLLRRVLLDRWMPGKTRTKQQRGMI